MQLVWSLPVCLASFLVGQRVLTFTPSDLKKRVWALPVCLASFWQGSGFLLLHCPTYKKSLVTTRLSSQFLAGQRVLTSTPSGSRKSLVATRLSSQFSGRAAGSYQQSLFQALLTAIQQGPGVNKHICLIHTIKQTNNNN